MLLGMIAWVMSLFYFVNYPDPDVREATWTTLSAMIAIFCGVLLFSCLKASVSDFAGEEGGHHGPPSMHNMYMNLARFVLVYALLQFSFVRYQKRPLPMQYFSGVWQHVVGFAAIDVCGTTLQLTFFSESLVNVVAGVVLSAIAIFAVFHAMGLVRRRLYAEEEHDHWHEHCEEYENDAFGLAVGLLISMALRMSITGQLPSVHGNPKTKTQQEVLILFVLSMAMGGFVLLASYTTQAIVARRRHVSLLAQRGACLFQATASLCMGWCLLYWGYWQFYAFTDDKDQVGGKMTMRIIMALVFSAISFTAIIGIDRVADHVRGTSGEKCLRDLLITFALLMGLSWEAAFTEAINGVGAAFPVHPSLASMSFDSSIVTVTLGLALCAVVLPAWALFILPNTKMYKEVLMLHDHGDAVHGSMFAEPHKAHP